MAEYDFSKITDSTDWLPTPLKSISAIESGLRCLVCRDFFKTPMLTSCSHTFCSLCIRRALSNDGKCPLCRTPDQESKLRSNGTLGDVVEAFTRARPEILGFARAGTQTQTQTSRISPKHKLEHNPSQESDDNTRSKRLRTSTRRSAARGGQLTADMLQNESAQAEHVEDNASGDADILSSPVYVSPSREEPHPTSPSPDDGMASCPICDRRMKQWQVFSHLDNCTGSQPTSPAPAPRLPAAPRYALHPSPRKAAGDIERLPALNYSIIKDQALRKRMSELGISSNGPRALLERRDKEWRTIWNANCDSTRPRPRSELLHDLEVWERTQGGGISIMSRSRTSIKDKEFDGSAWATKYDSSFKDLIANARKGRSSKGEAVKPPDVDPELEESAAG